MKKSIQSAFLAFVVLTVLMSGCAPSPEKIAAQTAVALTATASEWTLTPSLTPTLTPTATATSTPTSTPTPTPTVEPPAPLTELLTDLKVVSIDTFDSLNENDWAMSSSPSVENGALVLKGVNSVNWEYITNTNVFEGGEGVLFKFKLSSRSIKHSLIFFENGAYGTPDFNHVGLDYNDGNGLSVSVFRSDWVGYPLAGFSIKPEIWYEAVLAIDKNAKFLIYIWNPEKPNQHYQFKSIISDKWTDQVWTFGANIDQEGQIFFDDFSKITFEEMK